MIVQEQSVNLLSDNIFLRSTLLMGVIMCLTSYKQLKLSDLMINPNTCIKYISQLLDAILRGHFPYLRMRANNGEYLL